MAAMYRTGRTSTKVKKTRLDTERLKLSSLIDTKESFTEEDGGKKKNRFDFIYKIVIIGDKACGKSCLAARFCDENVKVPSDPTFITSFHIKTLELDGYIVKLEIWDTSGDDKFEHLVSMFYPDTSAIILTYDVTNRSSLDTCIARDQSLLDIEQGEGLVKFLVGCKTDLEDEREVDEELAQSVATELGAKWFESSSLVEGQYEFLLPKIIRSMMDSTDTESSNHMSEGGDTLDVDDTIKEEVEIAEVERDGALGMLKKLLHWNF